MEIITVIPDKQTDRQTDTDKGASRGPRGHKNWIPWTS